MLFARPTRVISVLYISLASAASSNTRIPVPDAVRTPSLPYDKAPRVNLPATLSPMAPHSLAAPTSSSPSQPKCIFSSLVRGIGIHQATTCLPLSSTIPNLLRLYQRLQQALLNNTNNVSAELESSLRIVFHFGTFSLLIYALQPVLTVEVAVAVAAVIGALLTCAFCVTLCAFTMVAHLGVGCGVWMTELIWEGRRRVDAVVGG